MARWTMTLAAAMLAAATAVANAQTAVPVPTGEVTVEDLERSAKRGDMEAQYALGVLQLERRNGDEAERWLLAAAQRRHPKGQLALAGMYADRAIANKRGGHVAPFDASNAYYWLLVAEHLSTAEADRAEARRIRDRLVPQLPPELTAQIESSIKPVLKQLDAGKNGE